MVARRSVPLIAVDPNVANGQQAYVEGTRLSVGLILIHLAGGESEERILDEFSRRERPLSRRGLRAAVAYGAALAREEELSPPAAAALGEWMGQLTGLSIEQVRPRAGEILQQLAAGRSEPELLEADPTLSPELIRSAAAYGTVLARDELLPPALPEALDERALRDLLEPADRRLIDDLYRYRHAGRGTLPTPEREYKTWRSLVEEVETGQYNDLDEYLGVYLPTRDLLEDAVSLVSPPSQDRLLGVIRPWDRRFDAATRPVEEALLTRPPWQPLRWWWYRVPKRCGAYMAEALRGRGVL